MEIDIEKLPEDDSIYYSYPIPFHSYEYLGYMKYNNGASKLSDVGIDNIGKLKKEYFLIQNRKSKLSASLRNLVQLKFEQWYENYITKIYNIRQESFQKFKSLNTFEEKKEYFDDIIQYLDEKPDAKIRIIGLYKDRILENTEKFSQLSYEEKLNYLHSVFTALSSFNRGMTLLENSLYGGLI